VCIEQPEPGILRSGGKRRRDLLQCALPVATLQKLPGVAAHLVERTRLAGAAGTLVDLFLEADRSARKIVVLIRFLRECRACRQQQSERHQGAKEPTHGRLLHLRDEYRSIPGIDPGKNLPCSRDVASTECASLIAAAKAKQSVALTLTSDPCSGVRIGVPR
jgi:hypothetical protein